MGVNAFYDYELDSEHGASFGLVLSCSPHYLRCVRTNTTRYPVRSHMTGSMRLHLMGMTSRSLVTCRTSILPTSTSSKANLRMVLIQKPKMTNGVLKQRLRPTSLSALHSSRTATIPLTLLPLFDTASRWVQTKRQQRRSKTASGPQA